MVSSSPVREGEENGSGISEKFRERVRVSRCVCVCV